MRRLTVLSLPLQLVFPGVSKESLKHQACVKKFFRALFILLKRRVEIHQTSYGQNYNKDILTVKSSNITQIYFAKRHSYLKNLLRSFVNFIFQNFNFFY